MKIEEKIIQLIDGELSQEDIEQLDSLIRENPEIRETKEFYEQVTAVIRSQGEQKLRSDLNVYLNEYLKNKSSTKKTTLKVTFFYRAIAAAVALLVGFFYFNDDPSSQDAPIKFKVDPIPIHADSNDYKQDSLINLNDSLKKND